MKQLILVATMLLTTIAAAIAQSAPKAVKAAFEQRFASIKNAKWDKENAQEWEAEFKMDGTKMSASFMPTGDWIETETDITVAELPAAVAAAIAAKYPKAKVVGASKIETAKNGLRYEADLKTKRKKQEVLFDANGVFIK